MEQAFIIDGIRTPIGSFGGTLSAVRADDMAAHVIRTLLQRNHSIDPALVDQVVMGCANQAGEDNRNVARMAGLLSGLPYTVPAETVNILCASGMAAVANVSRFIQAGDGHLFVAGGVENMTRAPYVLSKTSNAFGRDAQLFDTSIGWRFVNEKMRELYGVDSMGETAENVAEAYKISRSDQDLFAARSQQKAGAASQAGRFIQEIVTVEIPSRKGDPVRFSADEFIKPATTEEALSKLRPAFRKNGSVTAGNSSGINDGAAALLVASGTFVKKHNLKPIAKVVSSAVAGVEPRIMGVGPVPASLLALKKAGLSFSDLSHIELNEAFAAQSLACIREWGLSDDDSRINPYGGAIALGHPLGMSGSRLILTAARQLADSGGRYALCTMCIGVGQGYAVIIENTAK
ncbi:MAG TPA: 3-oxoadipyl-CoA thiolase [Bacteroidia bacterium]|nr:3-oxoadipyl-CoA thiolase [Bacteroidia bacterium]